MTDLSVPLGALGAYEEVMRFAAAHGEDALRLAMHAAVAQVLRPELLHLLRINFVPEAADDLAIEADVLLGPFCEHLGNGYYRFDAHARRHLLRQLDPLYAYEAPPRSQRVASFLLSYFDQQLRSVTSSSDTVYATYVEVERWVALGFFDPETAAAQLANALRQSTRFEGAAARFRVAGLSRALEIPLSPDQSLLAYAAGVEALEQGKVGRAQDLLNPLGDREVIVRGVTLPSPHAVLAQWTSRDETREEIKQEAVEASESPSAANADVEHPPGQTIFLSYSHDDQKWAERLRIHLAPAIRSYGIDIWDDRSLKPGTDWRESSRAALERSRIAIVLVSASYLASPSITGTELVDLRNAVRSGERRLLWVCVSPCQWEHTWLAEYQAAYDPTRALSTLKSDEREKAFYEIAASVVEELRRGEPTPAAKPNAPSAPIFLCYRRGADAGYAGRIGDRLKAEFGDDTLFQDITGIPPGQDFLTTIARTVDAAAAMLVVIGPKWLGQRGADGKRLIDNPGDVLRFEVAAALKRNIRVIPVLVGAASMPVSEDLPHDLQPLTHRHALELTDSDWEGGMASLLDVLKHDLRDAARGKLDGGPPRSKSLRVFVSSTQQDLVAYRAAVQRALRERGFAVAGSFVADDSSRLAHTMEELASCDVLVCIVGWRYGYVPDESWNKERLALVELEYREARKRNIPILVFLTDPSHRWPVAMRDSTGDDRRVMAFREQLSEERLTQSFTTPGDLAMKVATAVTQWKQTSVENSRHRDVP